MGYWEQIATDNERERARKAALPRWRRFDWIWIPAIVLAAIVWFSQLELIWRWFSRS